MKNIIFILFFINQLFSQNICKYNYDLTYKNRKINVLMAIERKNNDTLYMLNNNFTFYFNDKITISLSESDTLLSLPPRTDIVVQPPLSAVTVWAYVYADSSNHTYVFSMDSLDTCVSGPYFEQYSYLFYFALFLDKKSGYKSIPFHVIWD